MQQENRPYKHFCTRLKVRRSSPDVRLVVQEVLPRSPCRTCLDGGPEVWLDVVQLALEPAEVSSFADAVGVVDLVGGRPDLKAVRGDAGEADLPVPLARFPAQVVREANEPAFSEIHEPVRYWEGAEVLRATAG